MKIIPLSKIPLNSTHRVFQRRETLIFAGQGFSDVYILRSGSAKSFITTSSGEEHITEFFYPGDLLGLDGFDNGIHTQTVCFLETSSVSPVNINDNFRTNLLRSMSHSIVSGHAMMMCLSKCTSEQKVAKFLLDLSDKFHARGLSNKELILSMTRTEIANYLGMAIETLSRILSNLQQNNIIEANHRIISISNFDALVQCSDEIAYPYSAKAAIFNEQPSQRYQ